MLRPLKEDIQRVYAVENFLAEQERNPVMADSPQTGKWRWDFVTMSQYLDGMEPRYGDAPMVSKARAIVEPRVSAP